jgi:hypothetical protein
MAGFGLLILMSQVLMLTLGGAVVILGFYVLLLAAKALRIYISKNS